MNQAEQMAAESSAWEDFSAWTGNGLRREVFLFRSGDTDLYGSLYASDPPRRSVGLVLCCSWGMEADRSQHLVHALAAAVAQLGGAGLVFHYPGYGESEGELASVDLRDLVGAAVDAVAEGERRCPGAAWMLGGTMLGASVAALAAAGANARALLMIQPNLDPSGYFGGLFSRKRRGSLGADTGDRFAFGYPAPERILAAGPAGRDAVAAALAGFHGPAVVVNHEDPPLEEPLVAGFEQITVAGRWQFGGKDHPELLQGAIDWLQVFSGERLR